MQHIFHETEIIFEHSVLNQSVQVFSETKICKMIRMRLIGTLSKMKSGSSLLKRSGASQTLYVARYASSKQSKANEEFDEFDQPIKFSTSPAATWPVRFKSAEAANAPEWQGLVLSLSLAAFLVYFLALREENDIDETLAGNMSPETQEFLYGMKATAGMKDSKK